MSALKLLSFHSIGELVEMQEPAWVAPARLRTRRPAKSPLAAGSEDPAARGDSATTRLEAGLGMALFYVHSPASVFGCWETRLEGICRQFYRPLWGAYSGGIAARRGGRGLGFSPDYDDAG